MSMSQDVRTSGAVLSTNADIIVNVGFKPVWVKVWNKERVASIEWTAAMADGEGVRQSGNANPAYLTSSGISLVNDGTNQGFKIGPDSQINPSGGDTLYWIAMRGHDPK